MRDQRSTLSSDVYTQMISGFENTNRATQLYRVSSSDQSSTDYMICLMNSNYNNEKQNPHSSCTFLYAVSPHSLYFRDKTT